VSGLARKVTIGAFGVRQMARAKCLNPSENFVEFLLIVRTKRRREMSVDLLMGSHFLAVERHDIFALGEPVMLGNRMGRNRFFGVNFKLPERGHRLKNGIIAHWSGARERRNASDGGRP
jgi:hypothetical protein